MISILPFCKFNRVAFRGDSTVQFRLNGDIGLTVADGNDDIEASVIVDGGAYAMLTMNFDAVLFQTHVVRMIQWLR